MRPGLLVFASLLAVCAIGCGVETPAIPTCTVPNLQTTQQGSPAFTLVPSSAEITLFPGQTQQLSVAVQPVGNSTGTVSLQSVTTFNGLAVTFSSSAVPIGSSTTMTLTAAPNIASGCFQGVRDVFTAGRSMLLVGTQGSATVNTPIALNIELTNPAFTPASTNLPVFNITTAGGVGITSKDDYVDATLSVVDAAKSSYNYKGTMGIKGHGNSTWEMPKKAYRLNLDSKAPLLGMTSSSNWILLANYDDKSMLRNDLSFQMSKMFGMAWTPSTAFVEVYLNGAYNGTYQLSEKVEVSKARLNIGSLDDTDVSGSDLTGGYLGEIDQLYGETDMFRSIVGLPIGLADPDPPVAEQAAYFKTAFTAAETSLFADNFKDSTAGWRASWDQDSLVSWFLVEELAGNQDADFWSSDYFYKPRGDSLFYMGPIWDMDVTLGNNNYGAIQNPSVPWVSAQAAWYVRLFQDPAFLQAVQAKWASVRSQVGTLPAYIDSRAATLVLAAANNNGRWPTLGEKVWPNSVAEGSYQGEIDFLKAWLAQRTAYMDSQYLK